MIAPEIVFNPPAGGASRLSARRAPGKKRRVRTRHIRYVGMLRIAIALSLAVGMVSAYLMVMADMTSTNAALYTALDDRAKLQDETMRYDDEIAKLISRERLSHVATQLHMKRTDDFVVVAAPQQHVAAEEQTGVVALLASVEQWFHAH